MLKLTYLNGFYPSENDGVRDFRWVGKYSEMEVESDAESLDSTLTIVTIPVGTPCENHIRISLDEKVLFETELSPGWRALRFQLDLSTPVKIMIDVRKTFLDGQRVLGVMIGELFKSTRNSNIRFYLNNAHQNRELSVSKPRKPFISAYYYLWYFTPEGTRSKTKFAGKWSEGYARALLEPPQYPTLGEYVMNDPEVIETHIDWAADHGIDCFICNWEGMRGHRKFLSENLVHILQGSQSDGTWSAGKIEFSTRDTLNYGWDAKSQGWDKNGYSIRNLERMKFSALIESRLILETWPPIANSPECRQAFTEAVVYMAENFFGSPQWQRINNRPVVYFYEVYSWHGNEQDFKAFRESLDNAIANIIDPLTMEPFSGLYIIADVVYPYHQDMERLRAFDGLTGYQPYPPVNSSVAAKGNEGWSYRGRDLFRCPSFEEYHLKFKSWCEKNARAFIPTVIPKYNDRGVRGSIDNYAYPPCSTEPYQDILDARSATLFKQNISAQLRWMTPDVNMLNINSWNEWFEDTSIEPVGYLPEMKIPDFFGQSSNVGTSTRRGHDMRVPEKVVIYDHHGHTWIDTPESIKKEGIDITQGYEWPCYGFDYLFALRDYFGISYQGIAEFAHKVVDDSRL